MTKRTSMTVWVLVLVVVTMYVGKAEGLFCLEECVRDSNSYWAEAVYKCMLNCAHNAALLQVSDDQDKPLPKMQYRVDNLGPAGKNRKLFAVGDEH